MRATAGGFVSRSDVPDTFAEFVRQFDEEMCWTYLVRSRWPQGVEGACGFAKRRTLWLMPDGRQVSLMSGTIMHRSHAPLTLWVRIGYLTMRNPDLPIIAIARMLKQNAETTWRVATRCRHQLAKWRKRGRVPTLGQLLTADRMAVKKSNT